MARGTVKDPRGHQSDDRDFGYIQRKIGGVEKLTFDQIKWEDGSEQIKVIPFRNNQLNYGFGQKVKFKSIKAHVVLLDGDEVVKFQKDFPGGYLGTIGIADEVEYDD